MVFEEKSHLSFSALSLSFRSTTNNFFPSCPPSNRLPSFFFPKASSTNPTVNLPHSQPSPSLFLFRWAWTLEGVPASSWRTADELANSAATGLSEGREEGKSERIEMQAA